MLLKANFKNLLNLFEKLNRFGDESPYTPYIIIVLSIAIIFPTLGRSGLSNWDEAIYASVARSIYRSGDFLHLEFGDNPYLNKPPLFMILTALVYHIFGINEFSARFISALFGLGNIFLGYILIKKLFGKGEAFITSILLLSNYHFLEVIRHGRMESMDAFFILFACFTIIKCKENPKWLFLFFISLIIEVLTKGPTAFIPIILTMSYLPFDKEIRSTCKFRYFLLVLVGFVFFIIIWFYFQYTIYGQSYVDKFIYYQIIERIFSPIEVKKGGSIFYYFQVIMFRDFSSWALMLPILMFFLIFKSIKMKSKELGFVTLYIWIIFIIYTIVQTKHHWYIFSIYVPLAYSCTFLLKNLPTKFRLFRELIIFVSILQILLYNLVTPSLNLSLKRMSPIFKMYLSSEDTLVAYRMKFPALYFYADCKIKIIDNANEFKTHINIPKCFFIVPAKYFKQITKGENIIVLSNDGKHVFFKSTKFNYMKNIYFNSS